MTGYTVHTGSSEKFSEGWDRVFGGSGKAFKKQAASQQRQTARPAAAKKRSKGKK